VLASKSRKVNEQVCLIRERERWKQTDYSNEWENKDSLHILTESVCIQTY
jgi:hypothetical protein